MRLPIDQIDIKLQEMGLLTDGKILCFKAFKEVADVHTYGKTNSRLKIVYVGNRDNLFGFNVPPSNKAEALKVAYGWYKEIAIEKYYGAYERRDISWGNCGYPMQYGYLRCSL